MSGKTFYIDSFITKAESKKDADGNLKIAGYANTIDKDRQGDIVLPSAWAKGVDNYRANPVLLFQHQADKPIGRINKMRVDQKGLYIEATVSKAAESQHSIQTLIKDKVLKGFSVGFRVKDQKFDRNTEASTITDLELMEISIVSIPANANSLFSVRKSFDTEKEYNTYIANFEKQDDNQSLIAGITSFDQDHYHAFEVDENGDGRTTFTSHGFDTHLHDIEDHELKETNEHTHRPRVKDVVLTSDGDPTGEVTLFDDIEENIDMANITKDNDVVEVSNETILLVEDNKAVTVIEETVMDIIDLEVIEEDVEDNEEILDEENNPLVQIPLENLLSYDISNLDNGTMVKYEDSRWEVIKKATKASPIIQIKEVDIDGNHKNVAKYLQVDEVSVANDWDIKSKFDLELVKHKSLDEDLTDGDRNQIKEDFDKYVNLTDEELYELRKDERVVNNANYQTRVQKLQNLLKLSSSDWTNTNYRAAARYVDMIKYLEAVKPTGDKLVLSLYGHSADTVKEETIEMATKETDTQAVDEKNEETQIEEQSVAQEEKSQGETASVQVGDNRAELLVEATGEKTLEVSAKEDRGEDVTKQIEELKELQVEMRRERVAIQALTESKMTYNQNTRKENPFSAAEMADAFMLCKAHAAKAGYNRNDEGLFEFSKLGLKIKAVTTVDAFLSNFSQTIHEELQQELVITPMLRRIQVDARNFRVPVANEDTDGDIAQFASGTFATGIADATNVPTSNQHSIQAVTYTPHKFMGATHLALDEEEDTVLPLIGFLRSAAARRMARAIDKAVLRGSGTVTGFVASPSDISVGVGYQAAIEGIVSLASNHSPNDLRVNTGSATAATPSNIASARAKLGKYGLRVGNEDLVYLTTVEGYNELVQTADFRTVDTFGPQATYHTGTLGSIYGIPVQITEFLDVKGSSQNLIGALVYKPGFLIAERRGMLVETEYEPRQQVTAIYMSTRIDMQPLTTNSSAGKAKIDNQYSYAVVLESTA